MACHYPGSAGARDADSGRHSGVLQWLFDRLDELQMDMANAHIEMLRQRIIPEVAMAYEQEQVLKAVESGSLKLDRTTKWIEEHTKALQGKGHPVSVDRVVACGVLQLMEADKQHNVDDLPETLIHDVSRINEMHHRMQSMVVAEVILVTVRRLMSMHIKELDGPMQEAKHAVAQMLSSDMLHTEIAPALKQHLEGVMNQALTTEESELLSKMVDKSVLSHDPVHSLIKRRVLGVLRQQVLSAETDGAGGEGMDKQCIRDDDLLTLCHEFKALLTHLHGAFGPIHQLIMSTMK